MRTELFVWGCFCFPSSIFFLNCVFEFDFLPGSEDPVILPVLLAHSFFSLFLFFSPIFFFFPSWQRGSSCVESAVSALLSPPYFFLFPPNFLLFFSPDSEDRVVLPVPLAHSFGFASGVCVCLSLSLSLYMTLLRFRLWCVSSVCLDMYVCMCLCMYVCVCVCVCRSLCVCI